jgi:phage shock protein PspC (stress-responsive transcriptional regulator)
MFCSKCGKETADGSQFCCNCGNKLDGNAGTFTPPVKRLMRSSRDKKIGGVCAGLGDYFGLDPNIIRVVWLLAIFCAGAGFLVYIILWIVLPLAPACEPVGAPTTAARV